MGGDVKFEGTTEEWDALVEKSRQKKIITEIMEADAKDGLYKEQTAVDWLIDQIESKGDAWENASIRRLQISIDISDYLDLKKQAKAIEKEQILGARLDGFKISAEGWNGECPFEGKDDSIILEKIDNNKYYNETYKK
jgi:hypothetical protein